MIEVTDAAANMIKRSLVEGKVIRMFPAAIYSNEAEYALALGDHEEDDVVYESNGVRIHMSPLDAELLRETIVDYINDDRGTGFIIRGPLDEISSCEACSNFDSCDHDHDHDSCDHDYGCGDRMDEDCGCS